jgi:two-component system response regulator FlrC
MEKMLVSPSIIVADDEKDVREMIAKTLDHHGYRVQTLSNGYEVLDELRRNEFDLIITDIRMPELSGIELLKKIKSDWPNTPVIMMSAYGTIESAVEAIQTGASGYMVKPFSSHTLIETVENNLNRSGNGGIHTLKSKPTTTGFDPRPIITQDKAMLGILETLKKISPSKATVLITGESGTGKELIAARIHALSGRKKNLYVAMNCAALPENLAESELFGHERGAFTGAFQQKQGKFEQAHLGTLVLDEISELPMNLQAKLLRVLQENIVDRVGGKRPVPIDTRIIAISNVDLIAAVSKKIFREDLFYRINVIPLQVPPLRDRLGDIPLLAEHFTEKICCQNKIKTKKIDPKAMEFLAKQPWKGNVRELENHIERAVLISSGDMIRSVDFMLEVLDDGSHAKPPTTAGTTVREMERILIMNTLKAVSENRTHAAKKLGISIRTLRNKLKEYKLAMDPAVI